MEPVFWLMRFGCTKTQHQKLAYAVKGLGDAGNFENAHVHMVLLYNLDLGLKSGWFTQVIQVTFYVGQLSQTQSI